MSKFRGSITLSIFSLSTLSNYHYWQSPKTRYWRLVRPYQTGIPPARLLALFWAHNFDLQSTQSGNRHKFTSMFICASLVRPCTSVACCQTKFQVPLTDLIRHLHFGEPCRYSDKHWKDCFNHKKEKHTF